VHHGEVESFINERREERSKEHKYKYHVPNTTRSLEEIIQFVPMEDTTTRTIQDDIETNEVAVRSGEEGATIRLGSTRVGVAGGSKSKLGFRPQAQGEY
jgi:hypothetical protein